MNETRVVPVYATHEMKLAGANALDSRARSRNARVSMDACWAAMLAAAPPPPEPQADARDVAAWRRLTSRGTVINGWNDGTPSARDRELAAMDGQLIELAYSRSVNALDSQMLDWLDSQAGDGVHLEVCYTGNLDARTLARKATVYIGRPQSEHEATDARSAIAAAIAAIDRAQESGNG